MSKLTITNDAWKPFSYEDYETARQALVSTIQSGLTAEDKDFLLAFKNTTPDWKLYDFARFPAVQWKLQNLQKLKSSNPAKHQALYDILKAKLEN